MDREAFTFFREHAGSSHRPGQETEAQGKARGAQALAYAEARARALGAVFVWQHDEEIDSSSFLTHGEDDPWTLWQCLCYGSSGRVLASLSGIDFGRDGSPYSDPYRRVVEAELALETFPTPWPHKSSKTAPN